LNKFKKVKEVIAITFYYGHLALAVDETNSDNQAKYMKLKNVFSDLESRLSFVESELRELPDELIIEAMKGSKENRNYLKKIKSSKKHALSPETEKVLEALSSSLDAPYAIYKRTKSSDIEFPSFEVEGKEYPLSFSLFENGYELEPDTKVRRKAFEVFSSKLREYQHTFAVTYQIQVQKEKTVANLRGFDSVVDSLLFSHRVDRQLFDRQIDLVMEHLAPHMRRYAKLIQQVYGLDKMTFADLKLPLDPAYEPKISIDEAKDYILMALSVLGNDYFDMVSRAFDERWIDFPQNKGKATGGFCATPYGTHPYILMTWTGGTQEVFILAHELGHAGHFHLAHQHQNIFDAKPSTYFVEAPSTMNELLVAQLFLQNNQNPRFQRWVLSSMISRTYYHNFVTHLLEAAFQREVYRIIDEGGSVQASKLNEIKRGVLEKFWGDAVEINEGAELTWMRQPHYYLGLYPYTYSAGLTIATEVSRRILKEGTPAISAWKNVLKAGGTKNPIELAKMAGVDITTEQPLRDTIANIGRMIDDIISLTQELELDN